MKRIHYNYFNQDLIEVLIFLCENTHLSIAKMYQNLMVFLLIIQSQNCKLKVEKRHTIEYTCNSPSQLSTIGFITSFMWLCLECTSIIAILNLHLRSWDSYMSAIICQASDLCSGRQKKSLRSPTQLWLGVKIAINGILGITVTKE